MRILVIGGTRFAGHHFVASALEAGHEVTLFNRGESDPDAFPEAERVRGDRDGGMEPLRGRSFDAVVDMCGYYPRVVRHSVDVLRGTVSLYLFVSSISVYDETRIAPGYDEAAPVRVLAGPIVEELSVDTYGALKVLCEQVVLEGFPGRALVIRPGLIVGPLDRSDRFTYWVRRIARGGEVLAPGSRDRPVQIIDARDLASWMLRMVEAQRAGLFNATGPDRPLTFGRMLDSIRVATASDARFEWVDESFLLENGVEPWTDLPVWLPAKEQVADQCNVGRAIAEGLTFRPLAATARDTLAWDRTMPQDDPLKAGIDAERERRLIEAWRSKRSGLSGQS